MNSDRFKDFDPDVRRLVLAFEDDGKGSRQFFDVDELEVIADYYLETHDVEGLEAAVRLGERLFPGNGEIRLRRAQLLGVQGRYRQGLRLLEELERVEHDNTDIAYTLGTLYSMAGDAKRSIDCFLRAASDGYELGMIYGNVADEYMRLGNTVEAVRYYRKAVEDNPDEHRSLRALAYIWDWQGRQEQAVQYFLKHVASYPYCKTAWYCLGCSYLHSALEGQQAIVAASKAVDAFEYALTIDGRYEDASYGLSEAYMRLNDLSHAVQALREMLDYTASRHPVLRAIGNLYMDAGNYHTAYSYYRDALKENANDAFAWNYLGHCCKELGYIDEAVAHYNRAINLCPDYDDLWLDLADLYIAGCRFADAATLLVSARQEAEDRFLFDCRLLYCYYRLGQRNRLFRLLEEVVELCDYHLSDLLVYYPDMSQDTEIVTFIKGNERDIPWHFVEPSSGGFPPLSKGDEN